MESETCRDKADAEQRLKESAERVCISFAELTEACRAAAKAFDEAYLHAFGVAGEDEARAEAVAEATGRCIDIMDALKEAGSVLTAGMSAPVGELASVAIDQDYQRAKLQSINGPNEVEKR